MICPILAAIAIMNLAEGRAERAILTTFHSDTVGEFCRAYTGRFRRLAELDPKHIDLYHSCAQFLIKFHNKCGWMGVLDNPIMRDFRENCRNLEVK
jgi:hypothetical protein